MGAQFNYCCYAYETEGNGKGQFRLYAPQRKALLVFVVSIPSIGARSSVVVKALRYTPEGRGFKTR
jgi:hypothetical protein